MCCGVASDLLEVGRRRHGKIINGGGHGEPGGGRTVVVRDHQNRGVAHSKGLHDVLPGISHGFQVCQHFACQWKETFKWGMYASIAIPIPFTPNACFYAQKKNKKN